METFTTLSWPAVVLIITGVITVLGFWFKVWGSKSKHDDNKVDEILKQLRLLTEVEKKIYDMHNVRDDSGRLVWYGDKDALRMIQDDLSVLKQDIKDAATSLKEMKIIQHDLEEKIQTRLDKIIDLMIAHLSDR